MIILLAIGPIIMSICVVAAVRLFFDSSEWLRTTSKVIKLSLLFMIGFILLAIVPLVALREGDWIVYLIFCLLPSFIIGLIQFIQLSRASFLNRKNSDNPFYDTQESDSANVRLLKTFPLVLIAVALILYLLFTALSNAFGG